MESTYVSRIFFTAGQKLAITALMVFSQQSMADEVGELSAKRDRLVRAKQEAEQNEVSLLAEKVRNARAIKEFNDNVNKFRPNAELLISRAKKLSEISDKALIHLEEISGKNKVLRYQSKKASEEFNSAFSGFKKNQTATDYDIQMSLALVQQISAHLSNGKMAVMRDLDGALLEYQKVFQGYSLSLEAQKRVLLRLSEKNMDFFETQISLIRSGLFQQKSELNLFELSMTQTLKRVGDLQTQVNQ